MTSKKAGLFEVLQGSSFFSAGLKKH